MNAKVTNNKAQAANFELPLVVLSRDKESYKVAVQKSWHEKKINYYEAKELLEKGYGLALNLAQARNISVIDFDYINEEVERFIEEMCKNNAVVFKTMRGYHVFLRSTNEFQNKNCKKVIKYKDFELKAEVYSSPAHRYVVLPFANTIAHKLGRRCHCFDNVIHDDYNFTLDKIFVVFKNLDKSVEITKQLQLIDKSENSVDNKKRIEESIDNNIIEEVREVNSSKIKFLDKFFGKKIESVQDFVQSLREKEIQRGERHNTFMKLSVSFFKRFGITEENVKVLYSLLKEKFEGEDEKNEVENIIAYAVNYVQEDLSKIKKQKRVNKIDKVIEDLAQKNFKYFHHENNFYIACGYHCFNEKDFEKYLRQEYKLRKEDSEVVFNKIISANTSIKMAKGVIVKNFATFYNNKLYVVDSDKNIVEVSSSGINVYDKNSENEINVYVRYYANIGRDLSEIESLQNIIKYFEKVTGHEQEIFCILYVILMNMTTAALFLTGTSGSGKTRLGEFLTMIASGRPAAQPLSSDAFDLVSAAIDNSILFFDEENFRGLSYKNVIKSIITNKTVSRRKLYSNFDNVEVSLQRSFIFTKIIQNKIDEDMFRRSVFVDISNNKISKLKNRVNDDMLKMFFEQNKDKYFAALLAFAPKVLKEYQRVYKNSTEVIYDLLFSEEEQEQEILDQEYSKDNLLQFSLAVCRALRNEGYDFDEGRLINLYKKLKQNTFENIEVTLADRILQKISEDVIFRHRVEAGLTSYEIADFIKEEFENIYQLSQLVNQELVGYRDYFAKKGYEMLITERKNKKGILRKIYIIKKIHDFDDDDYDRDYEDVKEDKEVLEKQDVYSDNKDKEEPVPVALSLNNNNNDVVLKEKEVKTNGHSHNILLYNIYNIVLEESLKSLDKEHVVYLKQEDTIELSYDFLQIILNKLSEQFEKYGYSLDVNFEEVVNTLREYVVKCKLSILYDEKIIANIEQHGEAFTAYGNHIEKAKARALRRCLDIVLNNITDRILNILNDLINTNYDYIDAAIFLYKENIEQYYKENEIKDFIVSTYLNEEDHIANAVLYSKQNYYVKYDNNNKINYYVNNKFYRSLLFSLLTSFLYHEEKEIFEIKSDVKCEPLNLSDNIICNMYFRYNQFENKSEKSVYENTTSYYKYRSAESKCMTSIARRYLHVYYYNITQILNNYRDEKEAYEMLKYHYVKYVEDKNKKELKELVLQN